MQPSGQHPFGFGQQGQPGQPPVTVPVTVVTTTATPPPTFGQMGGFQAGVPQPQVPMGGFPMGVPQPQWTGPPPGMGQPIPTIVMTTVPATCYGSVPPFNRSYTQHMYQPTPPPRVDTIFTHRPLWGYDPPNLPSCGRCGARDHQTDQCPHQPYIPPRLRCERCGASDHPGAICPFQWRDELEKSKGDLEAAAKRIDFLEKERAKMLTEENVAMMIAKAVSEVEARRQMGEGSRQPALSAEEQQRAALIQQIEPPVPGQAQIVQTQVPAAPSLPIQAPVVPPTPA